MGKFQDQKVNSLIYTWTSQFSIIGRATPLALWSFSTHEATSRSAKGDLAQRGGQLTFLVRIVSFSVRNGQKRSETVSFFSHFFRSWSETVSFFIVFFRRSFVEEAEMLNKFVVDVEVEHRELQLRQHRELQR